MNNKTNWIRKLTPGAIRKLQRYLRDKNVARTFHSLSNGEAFDKIYNEKLWGKGNGGIFYSGAGSHRDEVVTAYVSSVIDFVKSNPDIKTAVDLGCGDFNIGRQLHAHFSSYDAIDVSSIIIEQNKKSFYSSGLAFHHLSITKDELPKADVAFVRQVLQHLSNADIRRFLDNIDGKYRYLIVTETTNDSKRSVPNKDIVTGPGVRFHKKSSVNLTKSPFHLKYKNQIEICSVSVGREKIVTVLYEL